MDLENQQNETASSLAEILNSIGSEDVSRLNIVNYNLEQEDNLVMEKQIELINMDNNKHVGIDKNTQFDGFDQDNSLSSQVQLLSNDVDRRIGNYLLNELEKKQQYIDELEEAVKFQEKEIFELKQKLEAISKLELIAKIKSNMDTKLLDIESNLSKSQSQSQSPSPSSSPSPFPSLSNQNTESELSDSESKSNSNKVVIIKKQNQPTQLTQSTQKVYKDDEQSYYPRNNPDLVLRKDTYQKVKSITKEEEEPRYNGIMMLDRPKKEEKIKISLDYETETTSTDKISEIIKQRRRNAKF
jgi:hypothetical protein